MNYESNTYGWKVGISVEGTQILNLSFLDDTMLIAANEAEIVEMIRRMKDDSRSCGIGINRSKTKIMVLTVSNVYNLLVLWTECIQNRKHICLPGICNQQ